jgi:hypothetical protein
MRPPLIVLLPLAACMTPWRDEWSPPTNLADDTDTEGTDTDTGGGHTDVETDTEPPGEDVHVDGSILADEVWEAENRYLLDGPVYVESGVQLTIEAGTTVYGAEGSALVVTRDAKIVARGSASKPIVFTSALPDGSRYRGAWGGLVLLGNAPVNQPDAHIEGIADDDTRGGYGGADAMWNCGVLEYVRVEFAGYEAYPDNELNGITLAGCGSATTVRNVQAHLTLDDGIELFGGTVDLKNVVVSRPGDDGLDWTYGWTGRAQFVIVQQEADDGDNAIEADNNEDGFGLLPRSQPTLYNVTLVSPRSATTAQRGMLLRHGTGVVVRNAILSGFSTEAFDVRDDTAAEILDGASAVEHLILHDIGSDGASWFSDETTDPSKDDDGGFIELDYASDPAHETALGVDPLLPAAARDVLAPEFVPSGDSPAKSSSASIPEAEFWDKAANYHGAVRPGSATAWYDGWTSFPAD